MKLIVGTSAVSINETKDALGAGGEATVYAHGTQALKVYHDRTRAMPEAKIRELMQIQRSNVIRPQSMIYDTQNRLVGYSMQRLDGQMEPLCKFFTKSFKESAGVSPEDVTDMARFMQETVADIHKSRCLVVDLNELNILADPKNCRPFFIDTDSYQTPSYKATAIMASIRDPQVRGCDWTEMSDWYSFAILTFQMLVNIHPFKGKHPKYKPADWLDRMKESASVFDKGVILPPACAPLSTLPPRLRSWYEELFVKGARSEPPSITAPAAMPDVVVRSVDSSASFETYLVHTYGGRVAKVFPSMFGSFYPVVRFSNGKELLHQDTASLHPVWEQKAGAHVMPIFGGGLPWAAHHNGREIQVQGVTGDTAIFPAGQVFARNGCLYAVSQNNLVEHSIRDFNGRIFRVASAVSTVLAQGYLMGRGCLLQTLLGKVYLTIPYQAGRAVQDHIPQLDGYRLISVASDRHVTVVMAEKGGKYSRFVVCHNEKFTGFTVQADHDVDFIDINMTVLASGICVLVTADDEVSVFKDPAKRQVYKSPPFDSSTQLFSVENDVFFAEGNKIYRVKVKK